MFWTADQKSVVKTGAAPPFEERLQVSVVLYELIDRNSFGDELNI
jgi:hypothetical protein